jgi:hypothetical protein
MTNIYNKTETNNLLNTKQATLTAATTLLGSGAFITNINFNTITNKPTYLTPLLSNVINNTISLNESSITTLTNFYNKDQVNNISNLNSNYTRDTSNNLIGLLNTKQATLTAATTLLGIGSNLTSINYATLSNVPSTFPADMTNIYNKTETNNLLNTKQATLTAATTLLGIGSNLTSINYATLSNVPSTFPAIMTNIYTKGETDSLVNAKQNTLTATTTLLGSGASITDINFNTITNKPTYSSPLSSNSSTNVISVDLSSRENVLTFAAPLLRTTNNISLNESSITTLTNFYNKTNSDARYLQLTGGNMTGILRATQLISGDTTWQLLINGPTSAGVPASIQTIQQGVNFNQNLTLQATAGNVGIGTSTNLINKLNINGACSATIFSGSGASLTNIPYASITGLPSIFPADMTNIYNKTEVNNISNLNSNFTTVASNNLIGLINTKQATLTAATTLLGSGASITNINFNTINNKPTYLTPLSSNIATNIISLNESSITTLTNFYNKTEVNNFSNLNSNFTTVASNNLIGLINTKQATLTAATILFGIGSNLTSINYATLSNVPSTFPANMADIYTKGETNTLLNTKDAILTFSSPLIRTTNTISLNQSLISYNNLADRPDLNLYVLNSGGTMSGQLVLSTSTGNNPIYISSTAISANNCIQIKNNSTFTAYIGIGGTAFGGNYANNFFIESAFSSIILNTNGRSSASIPNMIVHSSGNVGIGTTNPISLFHLHNTLSAGEIKLSLTDGSTGIGNTDGFSIIKTSTEEGHIWNYENSPILLGTNNAERMRILNNGNIGIGTSNPNATLELYSTSQLTSRIILSGQEFFQNTSIQSSGIAFLCGVNRTNDKQLWIGDSSKLTQNSTNPVLRISIGSSASVDCLATIGNVVLPISFGNSANTTTIRGSTININDNTTITGTLTTSGNIDCGGGLALTGSDAFYNISGVETSNRTNTYINFKTPSNNIGDWCYLRQIGIAENYKLAFDFHDDINDARFCIRNIKSDSNTTDDISEVFNIDNGNTTINTANATLTISSTGENQNTTLFFGTPVVNTSAYKTAIIAEGMASWSRSRLHFCLNNNGSDNARPAQNAGLNNIRMTILPDGNVGIGNSRPNAILELYSTSQLIPSIILSGQEFYTNTPIASGGIAFLCGVNRTDNRQLWIGDSTKLTQNSTNQILRILPTGIDCIATNGTTVLPIFIGNTSATTINGSTVSINGNTTITGSLTTTGSGSSIANSLNITGATNQPQSLLFRNTDYNLGIAGTSGQYSTSAAANDMILRTIANTKLILQSNSNAGALIINSSNNTIITGNLGIANFNPIGLLHIGNSESTSPNNNGSLIISKNNGSASTRRNFILSYDSANDDFTMGDYGSGSTLLTKVNQIIIKSGAYANTLRLNNTGDIDLVYDTSSSSTRRYANIGGLRLGGWDTNTIYNNTSNLGLSTLNAITFNTGSSTLTERMRIDVNGNVGIGTISPDSKIHILTPDNTLLTTNIFNFKNTSDYGIYAISKSISGRGNTLEFLAKDFNISGGANITIRNILSLSPLGHANIGGLRLGGWDTNTIYNDTNILGLSTLNAITFNTGSSTLTERMRILNNGNIGIGTTDPSTLVEIYSQPRDTSFITISGGGGSNNICGIRFKPFNVRAGGAAAGIWGIDDGNTSSHLIFATAPTGNTTTIAERMRILTNGNVGIGTTDPKELLHVRGKTIIGNDLSADIPSNGTYGSAGTRIILYPGTSSTVPFSFGIGSDILWYTTGTTGSHVFYTGTTERLRINSTALTTSGNIDCGGGLALTGSDAFFNTAGVTVTATNLTNTYINFKFAGTNNDWCYLRQIGGDNTYKLTFDFHDDNNDARFSIRNVQSAGADPDIITEVFSVDMGNVTCTGQFSNGPNNYLYAGGLRIGGHDTGNTIWQQTGNLGISANTGNNIIFYIGNGLERMRILNNGNIGIGTTNPEALLHVNGKTIISVNNNLNAAPSIGVYGGNSTRIVFSPGTATEVPFSIGIDNDTLWYAVPSASRHVFYTGITERMRIDSSGNISIGTTNISSRLTINNIVEDRHTLDHSLSPMTITHQTRTSSTVLNDPQPILHLCRQGTANQSYGARATFSLCRYENNSLNSRTRMDISLANAVYDNNNIITLLSSGNVGIGTTNPSTLLDINGNLLIRAFETNTGGTKGIFFRDGYIASTNNYNCSILTYDHNADSNSDGISINGWDGVSFCTGANTRNERMRISSSGNVGIGTTDPKCLFQVNGIANIANYNNSNSYAIESNFMRPGSLTIGGNSNYGGGTSWNTNTAGLLLECLNNTEIAVHDLSERVASFMYYEGGLSANRITIGRDMGWGTIANVNINGNVGIGTTNAANYKLNVNGSLNSSSLFINNQLVIDSDFSKIIPNVLTRGSTVITNNIYNYSFSTNTFIRINYQNEVLLQSPITADIIFNNGRLSIGNDNILMDFSYPILNILPIVWFKFNNLINSGSSNTISLTQSGNITNTGSFLIRGSSFTTISSNSTSFLTMNSNIDLNAINISTGITFSFWANLSSASSGGFGRIFDFGITNGTSGSNYIAICKEGTNNNILFTINISSIPTTYTTSNINFFDNTWRFYTWSIDTSGNWAIYINNVNLVVSKKAIIPSVVLASRTYYFGKSLFSIDGFFTYNISDFRIYNKVLSVSEINELYNGRVELFQNNEELRFPPKLYSSFSVETAAAANEIGNCIPATPNKQTLTIDTYTYTLYYSTTTGTNKHLLFDFNNSTTALWAASQYTATGSYSTGLNYISDINYKGDWIIIKFPYQIILSKFTFIQNTSTSSPGLWRCYGSMNGINWTIINEASNTTNIAIYSNSLTYINNIVVSGFYTHRLNTTFTTPYLFIGWVFNTLSGNSTQLSFNELQVFGEIYNPTISKTLDINSSITSVSIAGDGSGLHNLQLENQINYIYPPISLFKNNSLLTKSITNLDYGNGTYIIRASSFSLNKDPYYCFDRILTNEWTPDSTSYSGGSGNYMTSSPTYSTFVSGSTYNGEWIQIFYDKGFAANSFTITGIVANNNSCPSNFILAGSFDERNWILLSTQTGIINYTSIPTKTFSIYNYTSYNYYRLIVTKTISSTSLSIAEISFTGTQNTTFTNRDEYNLTIYNTNEKQFPPRAPDVNSVETRTTTEIYNCMPANVYKQTLTVNNHGIYCIYSSSVSATNLKQLLFNYNISDTEGAHWQGNLYTANDGIYNGGNAHYIVNNYFGDWIIVKLPYKIVLTRFRFYHRSGTVSRAPGFWKCYGSNDGVNFTEIIEASNTVTSIPSTSYTTNGFYQHSLPSLFDIPYLYIGWTINKLVGGDANAYILNFQELQIFGKDDISNSYLNVWNKSNTSIFNTLGNVGIGTTNPTNIFQVGNAGRLRIANSSNDFSLIGTLDTDNNTSNTKIFLNGIANTSTGAPGFIQYFAANNGGHVFYSGTSEIMRILNNGNVGIGITNPDILLHVRGKAIIDNSALTGSPINGVYGGDGTRLILWVGATDNTPYSLGIAGSTLWYTVPRGASHVFYIGTTERVRINTNGNLSCSTLNINGSDSFYYFFNNTGFNHNSITDFNNVGNFGYRYVLGTTNGPGTQSATQYYSWCIGLGNDYNFNQFGCQFALPRNITSPVLSVRYRENNNWGSWSGITADALTAGNKTISGNLTVSGVLTASGTSSSGTIAARYFNNGTILTQSNTASFNDVCGKFNGSIWVTSWIASSSDSRIKNNINNINDNNALIKILAIEPKTYNYIDIVEKGSNVVYGFIAQQIKEVIPEAVNIQKSVIPNIYSAYECSSNIINITSNIEKLKINDTISIIQENIERKNYTITEIIPESNQIKINENLEGNNCFVYGTEVDDFHALNKDYIFTLNVCATQELYRIIQQQQQQINDLIRRIEILESK